MLKRPRIDPLPKKKKKKERKKGRREGEKSLEKKVYCLKTRHAWVLQR